MAFRDPAVQLAGQQWLDLLSFSGIVTLTYCGLFSAILHEAKPLKLRKAAIDNLARFRSESS